MRKFAVFIVAFLIVLNNHSDACIGKILNIGIINTSNNELLAELMSVLINERTGTTVNIKAFKNREEIYEAVKSKDINIVVENIEYSVQLLNIKESGDTKKDYEVAKREYRKQMNMRLLKPFGYLSDENEKVRYYYAAIIPEDVLIDFSALPRVINKLKDVTRDKDFDKAIQSVKSGSKIKRVAKDYLKQKKLI